MIKKLLATTAVLTIVAAASATGVVSGTETWGINLSEPVAGTGGGVGTLPSSGSAYYNFRLLIDVSQSDDWTVVNTAINLSGATFYQDAFGGDGPPNSLLFPSFPDVEYDSYFTVPKGYPNSTAGGSPNFSDGPSWTSTSVTADWFDSTAIPGDGSWYLGSLTLLTTGTWSGTVSGGYTVASTGGYLWSYSFDIPIPEPGSLALLALGGLALIRRR